MKSFKYGSLPTSQVQAQKRYLYGAILSLLYQKEEGYPLLDKHIQTLLNQISGLNQLFGNPPQILSIMACLEDARINPDQFRKNILDAANLVDTIEEVDKNV